LPPSRTALNSSVALRLCRFPDFSLLSPSHDYTAVIDAVFISHFHMDHVGALPYFTEVCLGQVGVYEAQAQPGIARKHDSPHHGRCTRACFTELCCQWRRVGALVRLAAAGTEHACALMRPNSACASTSSVRDPPLPEDSQFVPPSPPLPDVPAKGVWLPGPCVHDLPHQGHRPADAA
jgi:hypothetical protein